MKYGVLNRASLYTICVIVIVFLGGDVVHSVLENIWYGFISYDQLPFTKLVITALKVLVLLKIFGSPKSDLSFVKPRVLSCLVLAAVFLLLFQRLLMDEFHPILFVCGFSVMDGSSDLILEAYWENVRMVKVVESVILGLSLILAYVFNKEEKI